MGCDIHDFIEIRGETGKWNCIHELIEIDIAYPDDHLYLMDMGTGRDYRLFGLLFRGVRRDYDDLSFDPRGLPSDMSDLLYQEHENWFSDAHSASYLTLEELKNKASSLLIESDDRAIHILESLTGYINSIKNFKETHTVPDKDVRVVFWFDN